MIIIAFISTMIISFFAGTIVNEYVWTKKDAKNKREISFVCD